MAAFGAAKGAGMAVARAFAVTVTMTVLMMLIALGFMYIMPHITGQEDIGGWLPVSIAVTLVIFAVSFVASAVLMDRAGTGQVQSLIAGAVVALSVTVLILTIYSGIKFIQEGMLVDMDLETLLLGFAISLIASVIIDRLVLKI
ncbi:MAG: hypothetical protein WBZ29_07125 [Methanocella sp.]